MLPVLQNKLLRILFSQFPKLLNQAAVMGINAGGIQFIIKIDDGFLLCLRKLVFHRSASFALACLLYTSLQPCRNPGKSIIQTLDIARSTGADGHPVGHLAFQQHLILFLEAVI